MRVEVELKSGMKWWSSGVLAVRPHPNGKDLEFVKPYDLGVVFPLEEVDNVLISEFTE